MNNYEKDENKRVNALLYSKRSTTKYFKGICPGGFNVLVLNKQWHTRAQLLPFPLYQEKYSRIFIREVLLRCHDHNLMYACTFFPEATIEAYPIFAQLETQSLGDLLYQDRALKREYFNVKKIYPEDLSYQNVQGYLTTIPKFIWIRQSKIYFFQTLLFIDEIFLPKLIDFCHQQK